MAPRRVSTLQLLLALPPGLLRLLATLGGLQEVQEVLQLVSLLLYAGHGSALAALPHRDKGGEEGQEAALGGGGGGGGGLEQLVVDRVVLQAEGQAPGRPGLAWASQLSTYPREAKNGPSNLYTTKGTH